MFLVFVDCCLGFLLSLGYSFVHPFVCYQTCEGDVWKTNDVISMHMSASGPRGKCIKRSTLKVRRSKVKVTGG